MLLPVLFYSVFAWAEPPECLSFDPPVNAFQQITQNVCEATRDSKECKELYTSMSAQDVKSKALTCSNENSSLRLLKQGWDYYSGCYVGGWAFVADSIESIVGAAASAGKGVANLVSDIREAKDVNNICDQDPAAKKALIQTYNANSPALLKIKEPSDETLARANCAAVKSTLKQFRDLKLSEVGGEILRKQMANKELSSDEKAFVEFRNTLPQVGGIDVVTLAKKELNQMGIKLDCYNTYSASVMTCEAISAVASLAAGPAGVAIKAAKLAKIAKLAGIATKSEDVAAVANAGKASTALNSQRAASSIPKLSELNEADRAAELARRASLTKEQRVAEVEARLSSANGTTRKLSAAEADALEDAHNVAKGSGRGSDGTYASSDHAKKMSYLKRGKDKYTKPDTADASDTPTFTPNERKFLMEEGYAGHSSDILEARSYADRARLQADTLRAQGKIEDSRKSYSEAAKSYDVLLKDKLYPMSDRDYLVGATINAHTGDPDRLKLAADLYIKGKSEYRYNEAGIPKRISKEQVILEDLQRERNELSAIAAKNRGNASAQENLQIHRKLIESVLTQMPNTPSNWVSELLKP
jgi:hypothetical protein